MSMRISEEWLGAQKEGSHSTNYSHMLPHTASSSLLFIYLYYYIIYLFIFLAALAKNWVMRGWLGSAAALTLLPAPKVV
jgi:hypothetical protein